MSSKGQQSVLRCGLVIAIVVPVLLAAIKTIQILLFYDESTGMLQENEAVQIMNWIVVGGMILLGLFEVWMSLIIHTAESHFRLGMPPILGVGMFIAGIFFLGQVAADLLFVLDNSRLKIGGPYGDISVLQVLLSVMGLFTAVMLIMMAYSIIATGKRPSPLLSIIPLGWCILFSVQLLFSYENLISMQDNMVKTELGVLSLAFLYYMARSLSGMDGIKEARLGVIARVLFPGVSLVGAVPYCVAYLFGCHDRVGNMPYLALVGLSVLSGICLTQLCVGALYGLRRKDKLSVITELPPANEENE